MSHDLVVNGVKLEGEERERFVKERTNRFLDNMLEILKSRKAPGGHAPYWGRGLESIASAMPENMGDEHQAWIDKEGLKGVTLERHSETGVITPVFNSPGAKAAYVAARGMIDVSGCGANIDKASTPDKPTTEEIRKKVAKKRDHKTHQELSEKWRAIKASVAN